MKKIMVMGLALLMLTGCGAKNMVEADLNVSFKNDSPSQIFQLDATKQMEIMEKMQLQQEKVNEEIDELHNENEENEKLFSPSCYAYNSIDSVAGVQSGLFIIQVQDALNPFAKEPIEIMEDYTGEEIRNFIEENKKLADNQNRVYKRGKNKGVYIVKDYDGNSSIGYMEGIWKIKNEKVQQWIDEISGEELIFTQAAVNKGIYYLRLETPVNFAKNVMDSNGDIDEDAGCNYKAFLKEDGTLEKLRIVFEYDNEKARKHQVNILEEDLKPLERIATKETGSKVNMQPLKDQLYRLLEGSQTKVSGKLGKLNYQMQKSGAYTQMIEIEINETK